MKQKGKRTISTQMQVRGQVIQYNKFMGERERESGLSTKNIKNKK